MTKVSACPLPPESALHDKFSPGDFLDCYSVASDLPPRDAAEIITAFPGWAQALVKLRGVLTAPFGLANEAPPEVEDTVGIFPVQSQTQSELTAGFNDKHLNFLVSVLCKDGRVHLATWVHPHNFGGRAYLSVIMPFHIAIVRNALARVAKHDAGFSDGAALGTR